MRRSKYYLKLFIIFLAVIFTYTLVAGGIFIYKSSELAALDRSHKEQVFMRQMKEKLDTPLYVSLDMINRLKEDDKLAAYARDASNSHYPITQVFTQLRKDASAFFNFGFTVSVAKSGEDMVITPLRTESKENFFKQIGLVGEEAARFQRYVASDRAFSTLFVVLSSEGLQSDQPVFTIIRREWVENQEMLFFVSFYERQLLPVWLESGGEAFAIVHGGWLLASTGAASDKGISSIQEIMTRKSQSYLAEDHDSLETDGNAGGDDQRWRFGDEQANGVLETVRHNGYTIHRLYSEALKDWQYVYAVPEERLPFGKLLREALLVYGALALAGLLLAVYAAKASYNPVRRMITLFKAGQAAESRDEFAFIERELAKMLQTNEKLQLTIEQYRLPLRDKYMQDLLLGAHRPPPDKIKHELGLAPSESGAAVLLAEIVPDAIMSLYKKDAVPAIRHRIMELLEKHIDRELRIGLLELDYNRYCVIVRQAEDAQLQPLVQQAIVAIKQELELPVRAAFGKAVDDLDQLEVSYRSAVHVLELRHLFAGKSIITSAEAQSQAEGSLSYSLETERQIIGMLVEGRKEEAINRLRQVLEFNLKEKRLSEVALAELRTLLLGTVLRTLHAVNKKWDEIYGGDCSPDELARPEPEGPPTEFGPILSCFERLADAIGQDVHRTDEPIVERMVSYIHDHYAQDISLTDLSEAFQLTPNYISTIFKNYTGSNFRDYLNQYRVSRAKEYMHINPDLTVGEVARLVGCNNTITFTRAFKKYENIPPGQYTKKQ
ncbi:helix-turn-helix domain-containing protein [Paenibacillus sp. YN15]|uniref:helix-turn-helix domain-containing protein n=1 Tax=Paenibacillus sp. YN15 TaxID=1742774 RepID=UPI000DCEC2C4|nr:helix-turn-helix domain-containing protein [Paenibacillus sp. YN15]RAV05470.1 hypothetical protein DQG13_02270 [Paenibacillus sp. YN15]